MPEHQQIQKSKKTNTIFQMQAPPVVQTPVSNPYSIIQRAKINPKSLTHADIMQLQRTIGNRAVGRLLSSIRSSSTAQQATVQRQEIPEEEPLQGKISETVQRQEVPEEEEPLQGKMIGTIQYQEIPEEEEPIQGKMIETIQRQEIPEEEEPLQGKMIGIVQRQEIPEEEEPLQGKFENKPEISCPSCFAAPIAQRQEITEEEPLQGKMAEAIQCQEIPEEEEPLQGIMMQYTHPRFELETRMQSWQRSPYLNTPLSSLSISSPIQMMKEENIELLEAEVLEKGYSQEELMEAIKAKLSEENAAEKPPTKRTELGIKREVEEVLERIKNACYIELYRLQDDLAHNKPPGSDDHKTGAEMYASWKDDSEERGRLGYSGAAHTYGKKEASSFVSLTEDIEKLVSTTDIGKGKENVSNVITKAKYLCTYLVPKAFTWSPQDMLDAIQDTEWAGVPIEDTTPEEWLPGTPTKESEVLYLGFDLNKYMTNSCPNPYRKGKK